MNNSTQPPPIIDGGGTVSYVLVPFLLITLAGIVAAVILYIRRKRRIDRLRHQLLPVYTYDPAEELNEAEQDILWREEDTRVRCSSGHATRQETRILPINDLLEMKDSSLFFKSDEFVISCDTSSYFLPFKVDQYYQEF
uniref:Small integral membrane protein 29 n=1 Tax=Oryzias sinensis TaxID=183150 RepID=A0A8C8E3N0_9TELE